MIMQEILKNEEERRIHESRQRFIRDQLTNQKEYERRVIEAEKTGREEGIEIGEKRGEKKGAIQTAKAMIAAGVDIETICKATGLSPEELT